MKENTANVAIKRIRKIQNNNHAPKNRQAMEIKQKISVRNPKNGPATFLLGMLYLHFEDSMDLNVANKQTQVKLI